MPTGRNPRTSISDEVGALTDPSILAAGGRLATPDGKCIESSLTALETPITPTTQFFVRSHFAVPKLDSETWTLRIEGEVERSVSLSYAELQRLPHRELVSLIECAGNSRTSLRPEVEGVQWGNGAVGTARWRGVPMRDVLALADVKSGAVEVVLEGADRGKEPGVAEELAFAMSITREKALDPDTLLVDEMNGHPLSPRHGFPVRAVVPGWYGMASVKWLARMVLLPRPFDGHYRTQEYVFIRGGDSEGGPRVPVTALRVKSLITWPEEGQVLPPGSHLIRGVAWSGANPIIRVEVNTGSEDRGAASDQWRPAELLPVQSRHAWTHWQYQSKEFREGFFVFRARATDAEGHVQPLQAEWNLRGVATNSIHSVRVEIRSIASPRGR